MSSFSSNFTNTSEDSSSKKHISSSSSSSIPQKTINNSTSSGATEPISIVPRKKLSVPDFDDDFHESKIDEIITTIGQTFEGISFESNELASSMQEGVGSVIQTIKTGW